MIDNKWMKTTIEERKTEIEIDIIKSDKLSLFQSIIMDFYRQIDAVLEPNHYDEWVGMKYRHYKQTWRITGFFQELAEIIDIPEPMQYNDEMEMRKLFVHICNYILNDRVESKRTIRAFINIKYNGIIETRTKLINIAVTDQLQEEISRAIKLAQGTKLEELAEVLDNVVFIGAETWEYILLSVLSVDCPPVLINGIEQRSNLHTNMVGEISTAKTTVLKVLRKIVPKFVMVTKSTEASFEGISKAKEIEQGVIEKATGGILLVPEFRRALSKFQLLREAMDCDWIDLTKRGINKNFKVNTSFIVGSNPKDDFFTNAGVLRDEIPFEEGILSRFDIIIPFITDVERNADLIGRMNMFGTPNDEIDFNKIKLILQILGEGMRMVKRVIITPAQELRLKDAYLRNNIMIGTKRPLVILRDLETLGRFVNVITATQFYAREEDNGIFDATDEDVDKAISLWENLIFMRKQLYDFTETKHIKSIQESIIELVHLEGEITTKELRELIIREGICSQQTLYTKLDRMERDGLVKIVEKRTERATVIGL